mmetsp:Transcript_57521/g.186870  ORF Transcript_57521/g.186870 Transcript_57521/m.186870 type:complete len:242 (-) Transcript_57521:460-1185(-)
MKVASQRRHSGMRETPQSKVLISFGLWSLILLAAKASKGSNKRAQAGESGCTFAKAQTMLEIFCGCNSDSWLRTPRAMQSKSTGNGCRMDANAQAMFESSWGLKLLTLARKAASPRRLKRAVSWRWICAKAQSVLAMPWGASLSADLYNKWVNFLNKSLGWHEARPKAQQIVEMTCGLVSSRSICVRRGTTPLRKWESSMLSLEKAQSTFEASNGFNSCQRERVRSAMTPKRGWSLMPRVA